MVQGFRFKPLQLNGKCILPSYPHYFGKLWYRTFTNPKDSVQCWAARYSTWKVQLKGESILPSYQHYFNFGKQYSVQGIQYSAEVLDVEVMKLLSG